MLTALLLTAAYAYDHVHVAAAAVETRCNVPVTVEMHTLQAGRLDGWSWDGDCSHAAIASAFQAALGDTCDMRAVVKPYGVHVGMAQRTDDGSCQLRATRIDTPIQLDGRKGLADLGLHLRQIGVTDSNMLYHIGAMLTYSAQDLTPETTIRDLLEANTLGFVQHEDRRVSWHLRHWHDLPFKTYDDDDPRALLSRLPASIAPFHDANPLVLKLHYVGGPYPSGSLHGYPEEGFEGPYDHRTQWWVPPGHPRYRPLTQKEKESWRVLQAAYDAGTLDQFELNCEHGKVYIGTITNWDELTEEYQAQLLHRWCWGLEYR